MKNPNLCEGCGEEYVSQHLECFLKLMAIPSKAKLLAEVLDSALSSGHCRADNNEERLMIFRSTVKRAERLLRILRGQPEPKETVKVR